MQIKSVNLLLVWLWLISGWVSANDMEDNFAAPTAESTETTVQAATTALTNIANDKIPSQLLKASKAILVADVKKGGLGFAIGGGSGILLSRQNGQWSNPSLVTLSSLSWGLQAGVEAKKIALVFTKGDVVEQIVNGQMKFGAGLDLAVGPLSKEVGTDTVFDKDVYSYADGVGLFAGVSLEGSAVKVDEKGNTALYGEGVKAADILDGKISALSTAVRTLMKWLQENT